MYTPEPPPSALTESMVMPLGPTSISTKSPPSTGNACIDPRLRREDKLRAWAAADADDLSVDELEADVVAGEAEEVEEAERLGPDDPEMVKNVAEEPEEEDVEEEEVEVVLEEVVFDVELGVEVLVARDGELVVSERLLPRTLIPPRAGSELVVTLI